jgi:[DsrC]-trisulfide reductase subunit M
MGTIIIIAVYGVYAAFWIRFFLHTLAWWRGRAEDMVAVLPQRPPLLKTWVLTLRDVVLFWRLLKVNPALWFGEYLFHSTFLLVALRHLRYCLDPVPLWVWDLQLPGLVAGYVLPFSLVYILAVRFFSEREKYSSPANVLLLALILAISSIGVLMHAFFKPNLVDVKYFVLGLLSLAPTPLPAGVLFPLHLALVLLLAALVPSHIVTAPLVMLEARRRELGLPQVMHEK